MSSTARKLAAELYKAPQRLDLLHALRAELRAQGKMSELSAVMCWWAHHAPDNASAALALIEAARLLMQIDADDPEILNLLLVALRKDPTQEAAAHLIRDHLLRAQDAEQLAGILEEWALAVRRDRLPATLAALSSFMLAHVRLTHLRDLDGGIDALEDVLRAFPEHQQAKRMLARQLEKRAHITACDNDSCALNDVHRAAQLYVEMGTYEPGDPGIADLERALDLVPTHETALDILLARLGDSRVEVRISRLCAYVTGAPDRANTHQHEVQLVRLLLLQHRLTEAVPHLRSLAGRGHQEAKALLARICPEAKPITVRRPIPLPPLSTTREGSRPTPKATPQRAANNDSAGDQRDTATYDESMRKLVLAELSEHTGQRVDDESLGERDLNLDDPPVVAERSGMRRPGVLPAKAVRR